MTQTPPQQTPSDNPDQTGTDPILPGGPEHLPEDPDIVPRKNPDEPQRKAPGTT